MYTPAHNYPLYGGGKNTNHSTLSLYIHICMFMCVCVYIYIYTIHIYQTTKALPMVGAENIKSPHLHIYIYTSP